MDALSDRDKVVLLPKLIGEGRLKIAELSGLVEYAMRIEELNRGLQRAGEAAAATCATCLTLNSIAISSR
jgi:hypothetical protein